MKIDGIKEMKGVQYHEACLRSENLGGEANADRALDRIKNGDAVELRLDDESHMSFIGPSGAWITGFAVRMKKTEIRTLQHPIHRGRGCTGGYKEGGQCLD